MCDSVRSHLLLSAVIQSSVWWNWGRRSLIAAYLGEFLCKIPWNPTVFTLKSTVYTPLINPTWTSAYTPRYAQIYAKDHDCLINEAHCVLCHFALTFCHMLITESGCLDPTWVPKLHSPNFKGCFIVLFRVRGWIFPSSECKWMQH